MAMSLKNILKKLKLNWEDLTEEEKATYRMWEETMKGEMTVGKIKDFLKLQIEEIEMTWANPENSNQKDIFLKALMRITRTLLAFIEQPEKSKEWLDNYLKTLFGE